MHYEIFVLFVEDVLPSGLGTEENGTKSVQSSVGLSLWWACPNCMSQRTSSTSPPGLFESRSLGLLTLSPNNKPRVETLHRLSYGHRCLASYPGPGIPLSLAKVCSSARRLASVGEACASGGTPDERTMVGGAWRGREQKKKNFRARG